MTAHVCLHEADVLDLVAINQWPQRAEAQLRDHVAHCAVCAEVANIAMVVRQWDEAGPMAPVPDASVVWRRAQTRARASAVRAASRPVWVAQAVAAVALVGAVVWFGPGLSGYKAAWATMVGAMPTPAISVPAWRLWPDVMTTPTLMAGWGGTALLTLGALAVVASLVAGALRLSERQ